MSRFFAAAVLCSLFGLVPFAAAGDYAKTPSTYAGKSGYVAPKSYQPAPSYNTPHAPAHDHYSRPSYRPAAPAPRYEAPAQPRYVPAAPSHYAPPAHRPYVPQTPAEPCHDAGRCNTPPAPYNPPSGAYSAPTAPTPLAYRSGY